MPPPSPDPAPLPEQVVLQLLTFLEDTTDFVGVADETGGIRYVNRAARDRLHLGDTDLATLTTADLFPEDAFEIYYEQARPALLRGEVWNGYLPVRGAGGEPLEMWVTMVGGVRPGGEVAWLVISARDVTEWRHVREELSQRATHDDLTGLANRALLMDHLRIAQARARRSGGNLAVMFVDVDDLKAVNDRYGHHAGDLVLIEVARRLRDAVRAIDTVARVGGDEFVVLLDGVDDDAEAVTLANRIHASLESQAIEADGARVNVSASMGVAVGGGDTDPEQLLRRADAAMYDVKSDRRPVPPWLEPPVGPAVPLRPPYAPSTGLSAHDVAVAVTQGAIVPWYQPVVALGTERVEGVQAIARWLRADGTPLPAASFVEVVESSGVGFTLDLAMLRRAAADLPDDHRRLDHWLSAHVSTRFLTRPGVERFVHEVLNRAGLAPARLRLVVPAALVIQRRPLALDAMWRLRELGLSITVGLRGSLGSHVLDDLTDGIASEIRLGRHWLVDLESDGEELPALVADAHARGLAVRVAGIETGDELAAARRLGVDLGEGYAFAHPAPEVVLA